MQFHCSHNQQCNLILQYIDCNRKKSNRIVSNPADGAPFNELSSYVDATSVREDESRNLRELESGYLYLPRNFLPKDP